MASPAAEPIGTPHPALSRRRELGATSARSLLLTVPEDFAEEVERAKANREFGDLELLSEEVRGLEWGSEGLRLAGRAQFDLKAWEGAPGTLCVPWREQTPKRTKGLARSTSGWAIWWNRTSP